LVIERGKKKEGATGVSPNKNREHVKGKKGASVG